MAAHRHIVEKDRRLGVPSGFDAVVDDPVHPASWPGRDDEGVPVTSATGALGVNGARRCGKIDGFGGILLVGQFRRKVVHAFIVPPTVGNRR